MASPQSLVIWRYLPYYTHGKTSTPAHEQRFLKAHRAYNPFCSQTFYWATASGPTIPACFRRDASRPPLGLTLLQLGRLSCLLAGRRRILVPTAKRERLCMDRNELDPSVPSVTEVKKIPLIIKVYAVLCILSGVGYAPVGRQPLCGRSSPRSSTATPPPTSATTRSSQSALSSPASCSRLPVPSS